MTRLNEIPEEKMAAYRATARKRREERERKLAERRERAWEVARTGAELLKEKYGATKVVLIGSLARGGPFDEHSDVDLIAWGVDEMKLYRAVADLLSIEPRVSVDLILAEEVRTSFLKVAESEGVVL